MQLREASYSVYVCTHSRQTHFLRRSFPLREWTQLGQENIPLEPVAMVSAA